VCVDDRFPGPLAKHYTNLPVKGTIYTVRAVFVARAVMHPSAAGAADGEIGILLKELKNPPDPRNKYGQELGFKSDRFRPLDTREESEHAEDGELVTIGVSKPQPPEPLKTMPWPPTES